MHTELRSWRRAWPRVGKATVDVEVEAEVVEEEEEDAEEEKEEEGGGGRRRTTLIKPNNPHLAGGEKQLFSSSLFRGYYKPYPLVN